MDRARQGVSYVLSRLVVVLRDPKVGAFSHWRVVDEMELWKHLHSKVGAVTHFCMANEKELWKHLRCT